MTGTLMLWIGLVAPDGWIDGSKEIQCSAHRALCEIMVQSGALPGGEVIAIQAACARMLDRLKSEPRDIICIVKAD